MASSAGLMTDEEQRNDMCVGTFRWKASHVLPPVPPPPAGRLPTVGPADAIGWARYLQARWGVKDGAAAAALARRDASLLDGMSYPLSLSLALECLGVRRERLFDGTLGIRHLDVVVAGASSKAEERLLRDSDYWAELGRIYSGISIHLWMVGPEIETAPGDSGSSGSASKAGRNKSSKKKKGKNKGAAAGSQQPGDGINGAAGPASTASSSSSSCYRLGTSGSLTASAFRGTLQTLFEAHPELCPPSSSSTTEKGTMEAAGGSRGGGAGGDGGGRPGAATFVCGFNPGFGSGNVDMLTSWLRDLVYAARLRVPVIFTQANDYSDLRGELAVLTRIVGAKFILPPQKNPFHAATCAQDPGAAGGASWSCANSYM